MTEDHILIFDDISPDLKWFSKQDLEFLNKINKEHAIMCRGILYHNSAVTIYCRNNDEVIRP